MKKLFITLVTYLFPLYLIFPFTVFAQTETATSEAQRLRDKIRQQVEAAQRDPKAFVGTIMDKTETGLQIESESGEIQQVAIFPDATTFVKLGSKSTSINFSDVAIGDYIAALGFRNGNEVLDAKRVLVTAPPKEIERKAFIGMVLDKTRRDITFEDRKSGTNFTVVPGKNALVTTHDKAVRKRISFTNINADDEIVVVGTVSGTTISATRIHVVVEGEIENTPIPTTRKVSTPTPTQTE